MEDKEAYKNLLTDIIKKQSIILGSAIAILKARNVKGITVSNEGVVMELDGVPSELLKRLVDEYVSLAGNIVKATLGSVFVQYPTVKNPIADDTTPTASQ